MTAVSLNLFPKFFALFTVAEKEKGSRAIGTEAFKVPDYLR